MKNLLFGLLVVSSLTIFAAEECKTVKLDTVTGVNTREVGGILRVLNGEPNITKEAREFEVCANVISDVGEISISELSIENYWELNANQPNKVASKICSLFTGTASDRVEVTTRRAQMDKTLQIAGRRAGRFFEKKGFGFNTHTSLVRANLRSIELVKCIDL